MAVSSHSTSLVCTRHWNSVIHSTHPVLFVMMVRLSLSMGLSTSTILFLFSFLTLSVIGEVIDDKIVGARIESCKGCRLNRLPDVKKFVFEDVPLFNDVVFKPIPGASPELIYLNNQDQEIERIDLAPLTREECNSLLITKGFSKRNPDSPIQHNDF